MLKPGLTAAQATEDLNALGAWLSKTHAGDDDGTPSETAKMGSMMGELMRALFLIALFGVLTIVIRVLQSVPFVNVTCSH